MPAGEPSTNRCNIKRFHFVALNEAIHNIRKCIYIYTNRYIYIYTYLFIYCIYIYRYCTAAAATNIGEIYPLCKLNSDFLGFLTPPRSRNICHCSLSASNFHCKSRVFTHKSWSLVVIARRRKRIF